MAQDIVSGLFGISPQQVQAENTAPIFKRAEAFANLNPMQQAQFGIYSGGALMGQGLAGLMGGEDPRLVQARQMQQVKDYIAQNNIDTSTSEGLLKAAEYARQNNMPEGAYALGQAATKAKLDEATIAQKMREKVGNPKTQAQQVRLNQLKAQFGEVEGSRIFDQELYQQEHGLALAAAGVPESGQVKPSDLSTLQGIVSKYTEKPYEKLQAIQEVKGSFKLASEGNTAAVPQLMRALVRIGGSDPQIAAREVAGIAGNPGAIGKIAEAVNAFWTGTPSAEQIKLIGQVLSSSENIVANQYMQGRQQAETVLGEAKISPQTQKSLLPPAYNIAQPKPKQPTTAQPAQWDADKEARYQAWKKQQGL